MRHESRARHGYRSGLRGPSPSVVFSVSCAVRVFHSGRLKTSTAVSAICRMEIPVSPRPAFDLAQCIRHDVRKQRAQSLTWRAASSCDGFHSGSRHSCSTRRRRRLAPKSIRNREQQQHPVIRRDRETEQKRSRQCHGLPRQSDRESDSNADTMVPAENGHGNATLPGNRRIQIGAHRRPGGPEHGIRQAQTDESHINHGKRLISHESAPLMVPWTRWSEFVIQFTRSYLPNGN